MAAGTLDGPTGLTTKASIWTVDASDYHEIDDTIPAYPFGTDGQVPS